MPGYPHAHSSSRGGWPGRRQPFLLLIALACLTAFYAVGRRHVPVRSEPKAPIIGTAWIVDGDSVRIGGVSIRLEGIDAPEWDQTCTDTEGRTWRCGRAASRALREHTHGHTLACDPRATDRYGRTLAICRLDGEDINGWLVRQGWAVAYGFGRAYGGEEAQAKTDKRGIWSGTFIYPSEWRRQKKAHGWWGH